MSEIYTVKKIKQQQEFSVTVPGSKSVTNRALMLAALGNGKCVLEGVLFSDDSRAFLDCLVKLGFELDIKEAIQTVTICGMGGKIPNQNAKINVRSAGTAARFLTVMLAVLGGDYHLDSSEQMKKRPMEPLITMLRNAGVEINCLEEDGHFPFEIHSTGLKVNEVAIDTEVSSQFASALLMMGNFVSGGLKVVLTGSRTKGAYIKITEKMLEQFEMPYRKDDSVYYFEHSIITDNNAVPCECRDTVLTQCRNKESDKKNNNCEMEEVFKYIVEPDVSAACYFWGIAAINAKKILVKRVSLNGMQGDLKFLNVLEKMGCTIGENDEGVWVLGTEKLKGISVDLKDFSDQTMTLAVIAPFADGVTEIKNISHIRQQESDRLMAIVNELTGMGIKCEITKDGQEEGLKITSGKIKPADIETYEDHRIAMAFAMAGTRCDGIRIKNPSCCGKTFENYFDVLDEITE